MLLQCCYSRDHVDDGRHLGEIQWGAMGRGLLWLAPRLMKALTIVGTAAMFLVGGGILVHGVQVLHHWAEGAAHAAELVPGVGVVLKVLSGMLFNAVVGIVSGGLIVAVVKGAARLRASE